MVDPTRVRLTAELRSTPLVQSPADGPLKFSLSHEHDGSARCCSRIHSLIHNTHGKTPNVKKAERAEKGRERQGKRGVEKVALRCRINSNTKSILFPIRNRLVGYIYHFRIKKTRWRHWLKETIQFPLSFHTFIDFVENPLSFLRIPQKLIFKLIYNCHLVVVKLTTTIG